MWHSSCTELHKEKEKVHESNDMVVMHESNDMVVMYESNDMIVMNEVNEYGCGA